MLGDRLWGMVCFLPYFGYSSSNNIAQKPYETSGSFQASPSRKKDKTPQQVQFSHQQLEDKNVIVESKVPENRRANIYFMIASPSIGNFLMSMHYKGMVYLMYDTCKTPYSKVAKTQS